LEQRIDVIATTISGSIRDWSKVERIVPLFESHGEDKVDLYPVDSHAAARERARLLIASGSRIIISAGGSGTFNAVLEGCLDGAGGQAAGAGAGAGPSRNTGANGLAAMGIRLGFLRKGSADLIGKVLHMPDEVEAAVATFVEAIRHDHTVPCDILGVTSEEGNMPARHFVGYGGAEIFGEIPRYTENRFIKWYKGILSQLFGDLGPFFVGMSLAVTGRLGRQMRRRRRSWVLTVDGEASDASAYQAIIIVNGDLGPNLPFAAGTALGSGDFHVFTLRDLGLARLPGQLKHAWDASIKEDPARWGFEAHRVERELTLRPMGGGAFPLNVDGSTMICNGAARVAIVDQVHLLSGHASNRTPGSAHARLEIS